MDFPLTDDQRSLVDAVRRALERDHGFERRRALLADADGCTPAVWPMLAELGVLAAAAPAECDGFGFGIETLFPVAEVLGAALVLEPWQAAVATAHALRPAPSTPSTPAVEALLRAIATGGARVAIADREPDGGYAPASLGTRATRAGAGRVLDGDKVAVVGGASADRLLVPAREEDGLALYLVDATRPGVALRGYRQFDGCPAAELSLRRVPVDDSDRLVPPGHGEAALERLRDSGAALVCAEAVGLMQRACDATLEYLKTRRQFGVPLGSFQALQHRLAAMFMSVEQARSIALLACASVDDGSDAAARGRAVSAAKVAIGDACRRISQEAVQLHGGMGLAEDMAISHAFRRLTVMRQEWGSTEYHLERFARLDDAGATYPPP